MHFSNCGAPINKEMAAMISPMQIFLELDSILWLNV